MPLSNFTLFLLLSLMFRSFLLAVGDQNGGVGARQLWCVAKNNAQDAELQAALDWACGPGGADCGAIRQGGPCYDPSDVQMMASYAFNDYYLKHGLTDDSCSFSNNAAVTSLNPGHGNCKFPSSTSVRNGNISDSTTTTTTTGMGTDSADLSGCSQIAHIWFWPLITMPLFIVITCTIGVN